MYVCVCLGCYSDIVMKVSCSSNFYSLKDPQDKGTFWTFRTVPDRYRQEVMWQQGYLQPVQGVVLVPCCNTRQFYLFSSVVSIDSTTLFEGGHFFGYKRSCLFSQMLVDWQHLCFYELSFQFFASLYIGDLMFWYQHA